MLGRVSADASALTGVVDETLRYDSPVQNTRRWAALDVAVAGREVRQGEMVLVVLGAANRDPAANADPDRFDPWRTDRRSYTFGTGAHACPGASMAISIAAAGVGELIAAGVDLRRFGTPARYRPSANVRMPEFAATAAAGEGNG